MSLEARVGIRRGAFRLEIELGVPAGETIVLVGPNGAGKSTLVEALAGLIPLCTGEVVLDGVVLERPDTALRLPPQRRGVGVVFQGLHLFPHLSVADNVAYGLVARGMRRRAALRRVRPLLVRLGLEALAGVRPPALSGGEAQRVALARALAAEPRLLLLDEPFSALDAERRPQIRALLRRLLGEFAGPRLVITHDPLEALLLGDRVVVLEGGQVTQEGSAETLRRAPRSPYVASLIGLNLVAGTLRTRAGRTRLEFAGGALVVPHADLADGTRALATIHPRAVVVSVTPQQSSARNRFEGRIEALDDEGERVRLRLATTPPLVAEVTPDAIRELALGPGRRVFASVKATEIDVQPA